MSDSALPRRRPGVVPAILLVVALASLYPLLGWFLRAGSGITVEVFDGVGDGRRQTAGSRTPAVALDQVEPRPPEARPFTVRWHGVWHAPATGFYDLTLGAGGRAIWRIDGETVGLATSPEPARRTIWLPRGFHAFDVEYERRTGEPQLTVAWPRRGDPDRLQPGHLLAAHPSTPRLFSTVAILHRLLVLAGVAVLVLGVAAVATGVVRRGACLVQRRMGVDRRRRLLGLARVALPALVILGAAVLRLDAITQTYGPVEGPGWLRAVQTRVAPAITSLAPTPLRWDPAPLYPSRDGLTTRYAREPSADLAFARETRSFYAAHHREPVFPFATRVSLWLLDNQDVAVSFASAAFSVLAVLFTYLLGRAAFSRPIGLAAAAAMAIEYDVISWGIAGWRDDAFTAAVAGSAWAMVRLVRDGSAVSAVLVALIGGFACLVRITALSFLLPGLAFLLFLALRKTGSVVRLREVGLSSGLMAAVVAPYIVNCWLVFGDPLYAINFHTGHYQALDGQPAGPVTSAAAYLQRKAADRPFQTLDTVAEGLTTYPFLNKWSGFDYWVDGSGRWLAGASLLGLLFFLGSNPGRLLLILIVTSLIPCAVTWRLASDWRFTEHAYPFLLVAAALAVGRVLTGVATGGPRRIRLPSLQLGTAAMMALIVCSAIAGAAFSALRVMPTLTAREALRAGDEAMIVAGDRDGMFFGDGWSAPVTEGKVTARITTRSTAVFWLPLPEDRSYDLTLRLDPFPRPVATLLPRPLLVHLALNGQRLTDLRLTWDPSRMGSYDVRLPVALVREGFNDLELRLDGAAGPAAWSAIRLWYVRLRPR